MARPRVVRYGATGHRVMRHPSPTQTMTAARAAMTGALARGQSGPFNDPFDPGNGLPGSGPPGSGPPGSDDLGGIDDPLGLQSRIAELFGMSAPLRPGDFYNPAGPGTRAGAVMRGSGAGMALQQLISSHYGDHFGEQDWGRLRGSGGKFGHRGTHRQWAGDPYGGPLDPEMGPSAATAHNHWVDEAKTFIRIARLTASPAFTYFKSDIKSAARVVAKSVAKRLIRKLFEYPVGPGSPVPPTPYTGYYPTVEGPAGRLSPHEAARMLHRLISEDRLGASAPWWDNQWLQSPTAASATGSGNGGGTSAAPESLLGGRKHPYDWAAGLAEKA